ncbi:BLUF domain-containing protein [Methylobacterium durans]|uniref:BLUF domain-containing protein n=1 Tax=Methylobacterium durans TaxID=2202825 RepID=UPI002AFFB229|nr:BLUF domain-containing protein [Methylobacterium durans]MEA1834923.1 BLUF domain-containing protein [Methylobacterium durans]
MGQFIEDQDRGRFVRLLGSMNIQLSARNTFIVDETFIGESDLGTFSLALRPLRRDAMAISSLIAARISKRRRFRSILHANACEFRMRENLLLYRMECSLLYVSRRLATDADIHGIVAISQVRNASLRVTGALVASRTRFAQILEGARAEIDELMNSISRDNRHTDIDIILREDIDGRSFTDWSLAYAGASTFVDNLIALLAERTTHHPDTYHMQRLIFAMKGLTEAAD